MTFAEWAAAAEPAMDLDDAQGLGRTPRRLNDQLQRFESEPAISVSCANAVSVCSPRSVRPTLNKPLRSHRSTLD